MTRTRSEARYGCEMPSSVKSSSVEVALRAADEKGMMSTASMVS